MFLSNISCKVLILQFGNKCFLKAFEICMSPQVVTFYIYHTSNVCPSPTKEIRDMVKYMTVAILSINEGNVIHLVL